jgi:hypothetical protein
MYPKRDKSQLSNNTPLMNSMPTSPARAVSQQRSGRRNFDKFIDLKMAKMEQNIPYFGKPNTLIKNNPAFTSE